MPELLPKSQFELRNATAGSFRGKGGQEVSHREGGCHDDQKAADDEDSGGLVRQLDHSKSIQCVHALLEGNGRQASPQSINASQEDRPALAGQFLRETRQSIHIHNRVLQLNKMGVFTVNPKPQYP